MQSTRHLFIVGTAAIVIGLAALLRLAAAETPSGTPTTRPASDRPLLYVWHDGGGRMNAPRGLKIAVWEDGTMLFSPSGKLGESLLVGRVEKEDLDVAVKAIREAGFLSWRGRRDYVVPDSASTRIMVHDGWMHAERTWHESLLPGFGGDINTDAEYRAFVRMWKKTAGAIESLAPVEARLLKDQLQGANDFRGYNVAEPWKTMWLQKPVTINDPHTPRRR